MATLKELREERIKKLEKLRDLGINPFPPHAVKDLPNKEITDNFSKLEDKTVTVAGRIMSLREHGQLIFADLHDFTGKVQLYIKDDELNPTNKKTQELGFTDLGLLDIGDFIQASGKVTKTKSGEVSITPTSIKLLTKTIRPLPEKREGLKDRDTIFRRRYLDLAMNPETREMFIRKSKFWAGVRNFLTDNGFIEFETPVLEHVTGGADAKPFVTHHEALDEDFYLRISTELYQKRLIGGGYEKIFTLGPNFRNEGLSDEHLQEFYQVEWYWAYANYKDNMELTEKLFKYVAKEVYGKTKFEKNGHKFDLSDKWKEIDYAKVIKEKYNVDIFETPDEKILQILKGNKVNLPGKINRTRLIDNLWKLIRKEISGPAFLINQPKFISPLAKSIPGNENFTERFQIIIAGSELGNGYSELNDPFDQLDRFVEQQQARNEGDDEAQMLDIDFVEMLEYGMPPTSGFGLSERVFWFLEGVTAREGIFFPQMRAKLDDVTKEIYGLSEQKQSPSQKPSTKEPTEKANFSIADAKKLLEDHVKDDYQKLHALMVAEAMKSYAEKFGEDQTLWYITGLLHDLDYFEYPEEHPAVEIKWFETWNFPKEFVEAVAAHAHERTGVEPETKISSTLAATDELAGFLYAYSLMRPEGFENMDASSVKKKFKDKAFARKVNREDITYGVEKFGIEFSEHVNFLIDVFNKMAELKKQ